MERLNNFISIQLIEKSFTEELFEQEKKELEMWLAASEPHREYYEKAKKACSEGLDTRLTKRELRKQFKKLKALLPSSGKELRIRAGLRRGSILGALCIPAAAAIALLLIVPGKEILNVEYSSEILDPPHNTASIAIGEHEPIMTERLSGVALSRYGRIVRNGDNMIDYTDIAEKYGSPVNTVSVPHGAEYRIILNDGTMLRLNAESSATFPLSFGENAREVHLSGEAYIEAAHDPDRPFVVHISNTELKVLGTKFMVSGYVPGCVSASLFSGSLSVTNKASGREVIMKPNQTVSCYDDGSVELSQSTPKGNAAWLKGEFSFEDEKIENIISALSKWYTIENVTYQNDKLREMRFTGSFSRDMDLATVLDLISMVSEITFKITGSNIDVAQE